MVFVFILLISTNAYANTGLDVSGLMGAEVIVDPYGQNEYDYYWHDEYENVAFYYDDFEEDNKINLYEGNACIEADGCYEGYGFKEEKQESVKIPLYLRRPFTFSDSYE
jgi:outer membrane protein assembly factor BamE (lipoprotein component of BamABCDE complex)